jgi:N-acetylglutamate synthase-like GNAT family acetyltransferase
MNKVSAIVIDKAKEADKARIFDLLKTANMHVIPSQEMPSLTYENYFVARIDDKIVGFCGYKVLSPTEAKTELMVVDPSVRGQGVGYKLQVRRMEDMFNKGIKSLITNTDLPETIEWYKKHFGYEEIGKLKKFHEFGDPCIHEWTTLRVDLVRWDRDKKGRRT